MASALDAESGGPGWTSAGEGQCVVFLSKILYSESAPLYLDV